MWLAAVAALVGLAAAFQPWRLLVDTTVDEAAPAVETAEAATPATTSARPTTPTPPSSATLPRSTPTSVPNPARTAQTVRRGELISHEHPTSGRVRVIAQADGRRILRLEGLETTNGPDLRVWLSAGPVRPGRAGWFVFADHPHRELGRLKANRGNQNYAIPADVDLDELSSAVIWCTRFRVSFGAAELSV